jgi:hypothetical protein
VFVHTTLAYVVVIAHFVGMAVLLVVFVFSLFQGPLLLSLLALVLMAALFYNFSRQVRFIHLTPRGLTVNYWGPRAKRILWEEIRRLEIRQQGSQVCVIRTPSGLTFLYGWAINDLPRMMKAAIELAQLEYTPSQVGQAVYRPKLRKF